MRVELDDAGDDSEALDAAAVVASSFLVGRDLGVGDISKVQYRPLRRQF